VEHYAGAFPAWLAPVQVLAVPVADAFDEYLQDVVRRLRAEGVRAEIDLSDDRFGKKIRNASTQKVPFVLIAGGEDAEAGAVSFRYRDGTQDNGVPVEEAIARIVAAVRERTNAGRDRVPARRAPQPAPGRARRLRPVVDTPPDGLHRRAGAPCRGGRRLEGLPVLRRP